MMYLYKGVKVLDVVICSYDGLDVSSLNEFSPRPILTFVPSFPYPQALAEQIPLLTCLDRHCDA